MSARTITVLGSGVGALALGIGIACSSFEASDPATGTDASDASDDSCAFCNQDGSTTTDADPDASTNPVEQISAGGNFACGKRKNGTVVCWGDNSDGQVGQPPEGDLACDIAARCRATPIEVPGLADVTHVSAGYHFACARTATNGGVVKCWGENRGGQLGLGLPIPEKRFTPDVVPDLPGPALDVTAGYANACARVMQDNQVEVICWGHNRNSILGTPPSSTVGGATHISGVTGAKKVFAAAEVDTACAIMGDDTIRCWGINFKGSTGHVPSTQGDVTCESQQTCNPIPLPVGNASFRVQDLYIGSHTGCALLLDGSVACWGWNAIGALGQNNSDDIDHPIPLAVPLGLPATALSTRHNHVCAVVGGVVRCWGGNPYGELGNNNTSATCVGPQATGNFPCRSTPQTTSLPGSVVRIALGTHASFATTADGRDWAWGFNGDGRLGHPPGKSNDLGSCSLGYLRCNPTPQPLTFP